MPSSRNTTEAIDMDQFSAWLERKLQRAAAVNAQEKLATGESVLLKGRPVPAALIAEEQAARKAHLKRIAAARVKRSR